MAWARAFYALAQGLKPGDRIVTGVIEYGANYVAMLQVIYMRFTGGLLLTKSDCYVHSACYDSHLDFSRYLSERWLLRVGYHCAEAPGAHPSGFGKQEIACDSNMSILTNAQPRPETEPASRYMTRCTAASMSRKESVKGTHTGTHTQALQRLEAGLSKYCFQTPLLLRAGGLVAWFLPFKFKSRHN